MRPLLYASVLCLALAAACAGRSSGGDPTPDSSPRVRIENRSTSDMDIYVVRPSLNRPSRLGFVPASDTVEFALARALIAGTAAFRLEARPIRAAGTPVRSEPFNAPAGEEIFWSIPPQ